MSLFQADEVRNPQGPSEPTFNASQFRVSRPALPGMSTRSMADQRVTPTPKPAQPSEAPARSNWSQLELTMLGPTPASTSSPGAAGPNPTHWPTPSAVPTASSASPARQPVVINRAAYQATGQRFGPTSAQGSASGSALASPIPPAPPSAPAAPPTTPQAGRSQTPAWVGRAGRMGGLAVGLGAKAFESINKIATDPARSGNPLYKSSQGWSKS
ncbi:hypothetical protein ACWDFH_20880 [Streptomyces kronopolitis]